MNFDTNCNVLCFLCCLICISRMISAWSLLKWLNWVFLYYQLLGNLTLDAYDEDCEFADPASSFKGLRRFKRNCTNFGSLIEKSNMKLMKWEDFEVLIIYKLLKQNIFDSLKHCYPESYKGSVNFSFYTCLRMRNMILLNTENLFPFKL